jgi:hypothetical protein
LNSDRPSLAERGIYIPIVRTEGVPYLTHYEEESIYDLSSVLSGTHLDVGGSLLRGGGRGESPSLKKQDSLLRTARRENPVVQIAGEIDASDREEDAKGRKREKQSGLEKQMQRERKITFEYDTSSCTNHGSCMIASTACP